MEITLINGSPKTKDSASGILLDELKFLRRDDNIAEYDFRTSTLPPEINLEEFARQDAAVLAFPLYFDETPSHLVNCLCGLEEFFVTHLSNLTIHAVFSWTFSTSPKITFYCIILDVSFVRFYYTSSVWRSSARDFLKSSS